MMGESPKKEAIADDVPAANADAFAMSLTCPVFFIGFMGAGKTSVARKLARMCSIASIDMDTYLERREGKRVKDIFKQVGETGFRDIETNVLYELVEKEPFLISCGGGVVLREENRDILKRCGFVVHLKVTSDEAKSRISDLSTRPLFQDIESARKIAKDRLPLYEETADITIDTIGKSVTAIANEVLVALKKENILCPQLK